MPKSKIQAEFVKATKVDPDEFESRQDFLVAVVEKVNTFKDTQWDKLSEEAQDWINDAVKKVKAKKRVPEFADVGSVPKDDEEEAPTKKKKAKAAEEDEEDEEEEEAPKKKKKKAAVEEADDDEDEEAEDDEEADDDEDEEEDEEEEEDEAPAKKKKVAKKAAKKKAKPAADDDDEDEEEEDEPKPKKKKAKAADDEDEDDEKPAKKKKAAPTGEVTGVKVAIKTAIIEDPEITVDALIKKLSKGGAAVSKVTVSNVRSEFRHTLKTLKQLGKLKGVEI